ncbi:hypothetical protein [Chryseobacterium sp. R2A-55]|uniref:hypothetical protein n=1 Tax=Chryseobacterium sp. R2A-55 TaxID=2744445 RepID=UPI001F198857|nr:hypothetical protein [Chryseobacterium sp. R2A-55]
MGIEEKDIQQLKKSVTEKFGKEIRNSPDCNFLSSELSSLGYMVHSQTLRRFFGVIKYDGGFSTFTLDALAIYTGFKNFSHFKQDLLRNELDIFFTEFGGKSDDFWDMSNKLCRQITESPTMLISLHCKMMKYPLVRKFFIEEHPMRDMIAGAYVQYFQDYLKFHRNNEAKIFAYSFMFMGAFLSENPEFMELYHRKIAETEVTEEVSMVFAGRKFGVQLLYSWLKGDDKMFQEVYAEMLVSRRLYLPGSIHSVFSFENVILEYLIFTDKTAEIKWLIENNTEQKIPDCSILPEERLLSHAESLKILCAVAYFKIGDRENSLQYLNDVVLDNLYCGCTKYFSILYYFVKYDFVGKEEKTKIKENLKNLIEETHFSFYNNWMKKKGRQVSFHSRRLAANHGSFCPL